MKLVSRHCRTVTLLTVATVLLVGSSPTWAQFTPPVQISSTSGTCGSPRAVVDIADNVLFTYLCADDVYFSSTVLMPEVDVAVTDNDNGKSFVDILRTSAGVRLVFDQESQPGNGLGDILTSSNTSGAFGSAINLTLTADNDRTPRISRGVFDDFTVVWSTIPEVGAEQVILRRNLTGTNELLGEGTNAHVADDFFGTTTATYERGGVTYSRTSDGVTIDPEEMFGLPAGASVVGLAAAEDVHVVYVLSGELYYANDESGSIGAGELLSAGPFTGGFDVAAGPGGQVSVVASVSSEIVLWQRDGITFSAPSIATPGSTEAIQPTVAQDSNSFAHIAYEEAGTILYVNNVPAPTPDFTAIGTSGELLLEVTFQNTSTGVFTDFLWDFGNGSVSTEVNPTHIYDTVGSFTVVLQATGPGGISTEAKVDFVEALAPTNLMVVPMLPVFATQPVSHPVLATNTVALQGFQVAMVYDDGMTPITEVTFTGTVTGGLSPELVVINLNPDGENSEAIVSVVFDIQEPFDGRTIDPGIAQALCLFEYVVPFLSLGDTAPLALVNGIGDENSNNLFTTDGISLLPFLASGGINVSELPQATFVRGDFTLNGSIDVADAISVLGFLFSGGAAPACPDSADANDTGAIDVGDAIFQLDFLFGAGSPPPYPFPSPGLDPTPDSLPCE